MATFQKLPSGRWQAQVRRADVRRSKSFLTRREAKDWAAREEFLILNEKPKGETVTLAEAFQRYAREVSPRKRGERWEVVRLRKLSKEPFAGKITSKLTAKDFAWWLDRRLAEVSAGTVKRELELLSDLHDKNGVI